MSDDKGTMDKIFDDIIKEAALIAADNLGKNLPEPEKTAFSKEHEDKMRKIFQKERRKLFLKKTSAALKLTAVFLLVLAVVSCVTVFSVEAWRVKIINFIVNREPTHSEINFKEEPPQSDAFSFGGVTLGYIPEGFEVKKSSIDEGQNIDLVFSDGKDSFAFTTNGIGAALGIDTEKADTEKIMVNGQNAFYSANRNINVLVWYDDNFSYSLSGTIEKSEMVKMAENIKK